MCAFIGNQRTQAGCNMTEAETLTADVIKQWADEADFGQDDIDNLAAIVQVGQLAINSLSRGGLSEESQERADAVYEALFEASSMEDDDDYPEFADEFIPRMAFISRPDEMAEHGKIDGGAMWEIAGELREYVDPSDVEVAQIDGDRAYVVTGADEDEVDELAELDVDAADRIERFDQDLHYDVAFIVEEE